MIEFLRKQHVDENLLQKVNEFNKMSVDYKSNRKPEEEKYLYYGKDVWELCISAILSGENILLSGAKATGKNVLASNLATLFQRPSWNMSFHINSDYDSLIGSDTFKNNEVVFRKGPILKCAKYGGFGILDEINMAKNEAVAALHSTLDHRRMIDVSGYEKIRLHPKTRFIATMNYGYVGTRELNEALASRFVVIDMPVISAENLIRLMKDKFNDINNEFANAFADMFLSLQKKSENGEISTKSIDIRGLISALKLIKLGISTKDALTVSLANKTFDKFEKQIVLDLIKSKIPNVSKEEIFNE